MLHGQKHFDLKSIIFAEYFLLHRKFSGDKKVEIGFNFGFNNRELISAKYAHFVIFLL